MDAGGGARTVTKKWTERLGPMSWIRICEGMPTSSCTGAPRETRITARSRQPRRLVMFEDKRKGGRAPPGPPPPAGRGPPRSASRGPSPAAPGTAPCGEDGGACRRELRNRYQCNNNTNRIRHNLDRITACLDHDYSKYQAKPYVYGDFLWRSRHRLDPARCSGQRTRETGIVSHYFPPVPPIQKFRG